MPKLDELGYYFDCHGVLRTKKDDKTFEFTNQEAYEELGKAIDDKVYQLLEEQCGLKKETLRPIGADDNDENCSFIFVSENCQDAETLLVLIHGSGVVRAGQWARRLIINNGLKYGTQIPYIRRAMKNGWGVVVMNTNLNWNAGKNLKYSGTPLEHAHTVWKTWVAPSNAENIYVVAHSRGGHEIMNLLKTYGGDERISKICMTDSPFFEYSAAWSKRKKPLFVINFLAMQKPSSSTFDSHRYQKGTLTKIYAGTQKHEWSSHCAYKAVFRVFEKELTVNNYAQFMDSVKELVIADGPSPPAEMKRKELNEDPEEPKTESE